jgi:hypothetical protein
VNSDFFMWASRQILLEISSFDQFTIWGSLSPTVDIRK